MLKQFLSSAAALAAATSLCAQNLPETNDAANNTAAGAELATPGAQHYGNISSGTDSDFWTFTIPAGTPMQINVWGTSRGQSSSPDPVILLHDSSGDNVIFGAFETVENGVLTTFQPTFSFGSSSNNGVFYLEVLPFSAADTGDYSFDLTLTPQATEQCFGIAEPPRNSLESEPNNMCGTANPMPFCTVIREDIDSTGDTDFWSFTLTEASTIQWETILDTAVTVRDDTRLWLYDSACFEIATDDDGGAGFLSLLTVDLQPGNYFLEVSDWQRNLPGPYSLVVRGPTSELIPSGSGTPSVQSLEDLKPRTDPCGGVFPNVGVDNEPNSTPNQAESSNNLITPCTDTIGSIGMVGAGITDLWFFDVGATTNVIFETINDSVLAGAMPDTELWLYDSGGNEIANEDDIDFAAGNLFTRLERVCAPGRYYIEAHSFNRLTAGTFRLRMTEFLPRPPACVGGNGDVTRMVLRDNERVQQGTPWTVDITGASGPGVCFLGFGAGGIFPGAGPWGVGFDLGLIGITNCNLRVNPAANPNYAPGTGGDFEFTFGIGGLPVGLDIHVQAVLADLGAIGLRPLPVTSAENMATGTVGDQTFH